MLFQIFFPGRGPNRPHNALENLAPSRIETGNDSNYWRERAGIAHGPQHVAYTPWNPYSDYNTGGYPSPVSGPYNAGSQVDTRSLVEKLKTLQLGTVDDKGNVTSPGLSALIGSLGSNQGGISAAGKRAIHAMIRDHGGDIADALLPEEAMKLNTVLRQIGLSDSVAIRGNATPGINNPATGSAGYGGFPAYPQQFAGNSVGSQIGAAATGAANLITAIGKNTDWFG